MTSSSPTKRAKLPHESKSNDGGIGIGPFQIPPSLYRNNRQRFIARMKHVLSQNATMGAAVVLQGGPSEMRYDTDHEPLFRQESNFLHLFGLNEPDCYGVLDLNTSTSLLFVPRHGVDYGIWCGVPPTLQQYRERYDVDNVHYVDELKDILKARNIKDIHVIYGKNSDSGNYSMEVKFEGMNEFKEVRDRAHREIVECRVVKSDEEIEVLRYVVGLACTAHEAVMRQARPNMMEYQLESVFRHTTQMKGGSRYLAYTCICGSGCNGSVLHYGHAGAPNDRKIYDGDMMLLDMGCEYQGYCSDITCSYPINGRFTDDQKIIYNTVLAAVKAVESTMKPGVNWVDMHRLAQKTIIEHLVTHDLVRLNGKTIYDLQKLHLGAIFMPHGLGHFMGLDTHDVGGYPHGVERVDEPSVRNLRTARTLKAGMVLTVEPGVYFIRELIDRAMNNEEQAKHLNMDRIKDFMNFGGVRIEDDVLVTNDGIENLTTIPREIEDIERIMAEGMTSIE